MSEGGILTLLGIIVSLIVGLAGAMKGTRLWRAKRLRELVKEREAELDVKEKELNQRDAEAMTELKTEVKKLREELAAEKEERETQAAQFFQILQTFRNREWRLSEHVHVLETLLRAKGIGFDPLPNDLRELPQEMSHFFRRSTDPKPTEAT